MTDPNLKRDYAAWLVIATHTHQESYAVENLKLQGYHAYLPMVMRHIRHARRAYDSPRPLFPGYVFVEEPQPHKWHSLRYTFGVRNVLTCGEGLARLPPGFIEGLWAREVNGCVCKPEAPLKVGQRVTIQRGAFDGLIGQIVELRDNERVLVLVDLLNRQTRVHIHAKELI